MTSEADVLLLEMCKLTACIPAGGYDPNIYSIREMAERLGMSKYKTRQAMKELEAHEMVRRSYEGGIDEDGYPHCYHGWSITRKTRETTLYKQCEKKALEDFERWQMDFEEKWRQEEAERIGNR